MFRLRPYSIKSVMKELKIKIKIKIKNKKNKIGDAS
jgi:hypothetical protein